ncbi:MAG: hypothetical protein KJ578_04130 [Bacteroidetes bacterium]|nr:hypothetical protein [Bacteroidota bacterium]MBU2556950.1 hypothetical protein [Bacteroidota bacterium]
MTDDKRVYFLFSRLETDQSNKAVYNIVLDYFLDNKNNFASVIDISNSLVPKKINFSPETIQNILLQLNYSELFDQLTTQKELNEPFRFKSSVYEKLSSYTNYINKLNIYVNTFLGSKGYPKKRSESVIEILLETIFTRNIQYLKKILSAKEEIKLKLQINGKHLNFSKKDCEYYNEMILESSSEFNEILRVLILKMFEFLSLNHNPKHKETMNQRFNGRVFYLDSSFILRLFGFDNEIREERSIKLINILKEIDDVEFVVHRETISEAQFRIKEIISHSVPIIHHREKIIKKIFEYVPEKGSNTVNLYFRLKALGKITNEKDFLIYFANITQKLKDVFKSQKFRIDDTSIKLSKTKAGDLLTKLSKTEKSKPRIKHIIKLLSHLENLRGANKYNPFDIKYWLVTTDNKTLNIDYEICEKSDSALKSVCILPTELIRMIDGVGEITGDHITVFKSYILQSHVFVENYNENDVNVIERIATLIETVDLVKYDSEEMIKNLFEKNSFVDIQKRLNNIESEKEKNETLVTLFNEANEGYIETKYTNLLCKLSNSYTKIGKIIFPISVFLLPTLFFIYIGKQIINPNLNIIDPKTYFIKESWDSLNIVITIFNGTILTIAFLINRKYSDKFVKWYVRWRLRKYK